MSGVTNLSKPFRRRDDGTVVTIADAIVECLAAGNYVETAAASVGMHRVSLLRVMARGAKALRANAATGKAVPKSEKVYAVFSAQVQEATARAEARAVEAIARLAEGGYEVRETSIEYVTDPSGVRTEVKRTETTKQLAPNFRAIAWRLERRNRDHWGRFGSLGPVDADGAPEQTREERMEAIVAAAADYPDEYLVGFEDGKKAAAETDA